MQKFGTFIAAALFLAGSHSAHADFTVNDLREYCEGRVQTAKWGACLGYIGGTLDVYRAEHMKFCIPDGVDPQQFIAVWNKFLQKHPEKWHLTAAPLIAQAISEAFPCQ